MGKKFFVKKSLGAPLDHLRKMCLEISGKIPKKICLPSILFIKWTPQNEPKYGPDGKIQIDLTNLKVSFDNF